MLWFSLITVFVSAQNVIERSASEAYDIILNLDYEYSTLIDGRTAAMYRDGHIKNAVNINAFLPDVNDRLKPYLSKNQLVVYCTNQNRSLKLIDALKSLGYSGEIIFVSDGITGWKSNGFKLVNVEASPKKDTNNSEEKPKLQPIVQVFGTASYDVDNQFYDYSFGRAHLGLAYKFNEKYSAKIVIDRGAPTSLNEIFVTDSVGNPMSVNADVTNGSQYTMWLKFASLKWQMSDNFSIEAGAVLQNHFLVQERFWNYRFVAQTFQDKYWKISPTDLGFIARYKINDFISIDAALTNGEGPRIAQDIAGKVKIASGLDIHPANWLDIRLYYHNKASEFSKDTEQLFSGFVGFKPMDKFRVGAEFNYMLGLNNVESLDSYGLSVFSIFQLNQNWGIFGRYDWLMVDNAMNYALSIEDGNAVFGGIAYRPIQSIGFSLNYQGFFSMNSTGNDANFLNFSMEFKF
jgi:rhodanese-related sulfurtransferase